LIEILQLTEIIEQ